MVLLYVVLCIKYYMYGLVNFYIIKIYVLKYIIKKLLLFIITVIHVLSNLVLVIVFVVNVYLILFDGKYINVMLKIFDFLNKVNVKSLVYL